MKYQIREFNVTTQLVQHTATQCYMKETLDSVNFVSTAIRYGFIQALKIKKNCTQHNPLIMFRKRANHISSEMQSLSLGAKRFNCF